MPTVSVNIGMSTSEEKLPVNGSFSESGSLSPVDEVIHFSFFVSFSNSAKCTREAFLFVCMNY